MWLPWIIVPLLLGVRVEAEATATTSRSIGLARAEAIDSCSRRLEAACVARYLGDPTEQGYTDPTCSDDDGLFTCAVVCWADCT